MGEQSGAALGGKLFFVPRHEFKRVIALTAPPVEKVGIFSTLGRINVLYMIAAAGSGHIGSSFSSMEIVSWLLTQEILNTAPEGKKHDLFFSSKGHDAPALYSVLTAMGKLDFDLIHRLRRLDGLPGHPDVTTPTIVTNTGSLGMGISKAKGMIFAKRLKGQSGKVYVLTGDGELQEGQIWESLISAANHALHELTVIVDHNKIQSDTLVSKVSDLGDLEAKFKAFGWYVSRCDGNNPEAFSEALAKGKNISDRPKVIIADTIKGRGVSFMEHTSIDSDTDLYKFHSGSPAESDYAAALEELVAQANQQLKRAGTTELELDAVVRPVATSVTEPQQRLIPAYTKALCEHAKSNTSIVALDADLILDSGLLDFQTKFPERFVECGIAEQDMVSQAGGMALEGLLPIVHSFACFLSARPNEQIYNNATEGKKILYVGSLAGIIPGGAGHSHQGVRDIGSLGSISGLTVMEPSCEQEVALLLDWAIRANDGSAYMRLMSLPWAIPYTLPKEYTPVAGQGVVLREGKDAVIIAYGPVPLSNAFLAAEKLYATHGLQLKIINLPWLNDIDHKWLLETISTCHKVISIDNHYLVGGQGDRIANILAQAGAQVEFTRIGLSDVPSCGTIAEVLEKHGLSVDALYSTFLKSM